MPLDPFIQAAIDVQTRLEAQVGELYRKWQDTKTNVDMETRLRREAENEVGNIGKLHQQAAQVSQGLKGKPLQSAFCHICDSTCTCHM